MTTFKRMLGEIRRPINVIMKAGGNPMDLSSDTVKFRMEKEDGTSVVTEGTTGVTVHPTQAFTADADTDLLTCNGHGVKEGDQIVVASTGTLPTGLAASTRYFARDVNPNTFSLATTSQDDAIVNITGAGSGTHTFYVVGSVQKVFLAADVDEAGRFSAWFSAYSGSDGVSAPVERQGITIEITPFGN